MNRFLDALEDRWPLILRLVGVAIVAGEITVDSLQHPEMILAARPLKTRRRRRGEEDDD